MRGWKEVRMFSCEHGLGPKGHGNPLENLKQRRHPGWCFLSIAERREQECEKNQSCSDRNQSVSPRNKQLDRELNQTGTRWRLWNHRGRGYFQRWKPHWMGSWSYGHLRFLWPGPMLHSGIKDIEIWELIYRHTKLAVVSPSILSSPLPLGLENRTQVQTQVSGNTQSLSICVPLPSELSQEGHRPKLVPEDGSANIWTSGLLRSVGY